MFQPSPPQNLCYAEKQNKWRHQFTKGLVVQTVKGEWRNTDKDQSNEAVLSSTCFVVTRFEESGVWKSWLDPTQMQE